MATNDLARFNANLPQGAIHRDDPQPPGTEHGEA